MAAKKKSVGAFTPPPDPLVEDIKVIVTERIFNSNRERILCYQEVGLRLLSERDLGKSITQVTMAIPQLSDRTLQRCVQFAQKFPTEKSLDALPFGKTVSWHKIVNHLLPAQKDNIWSWRIEDLTKVNPEFLCPDRSKIDRQVKAMGKQAQEFVGGIEVFKE